MKRVLLLELQNEDPFQSFRAETFPFLLGGLRALGVDAAWLVAFVPKGLAHAGGRHVPDLPQADAARLVELLRERCPDLLITNNPVVDALSALIKEACPSLVMLPVEQLGEGGAQAMTGARLAAWADAASNAPGLLIDDAAPCYERLWLGEASPNAEQPIPLIGALPCTYGRRVDQSPAYAARADVDVGDARGCSFCSAFESSPLRFETEPVELALRQVVAHQTTKALRVDWQRYVVEDTRVILHCERFFEALLERNLAPSAFFFCLRIDEFQRVRERLTFWLPRLASGGHQVHLLAMGLENF